MFYLAKHRRLVAKTNLSLCFPDWDNQQLDTVLKENFKSTGIGIVEMAMLWFGPDRDWRSMTQLEGLEHLEQAKQNGTGGLLLAFHLTSLEMGGGLLGKAFAYSGLYRPNENPIIESAMVKGRSRFVGLIPRGATREAVRHIKNNGFLWYAADQDYGRDHSVFVPFFGIQAATLAATTRFVRLTGAPVIPMTQERIPGHKIKITLHAPILNLGTDAEQDALVINQFLENVIRQNPVDYLWMHRRFKTRPSIHDDSVYPEKKKKRRITPHRYKALLQSAETLAEQDGLPTKLRAHNQIVYLLHHQLHPSQSTRNRLKAFVRTLDPEQLEDNLYEFNGTVQTSEEYNCDLVYLERARNAIDQPNI